MSKHPKALKFVFLWTDLRAFFTLELARNHIAHAKEILTSDEYASLKKSVAQDSTMPFAVLFSDG